MLCTDRYDLKLSIWDTKCQIWNIYGKSFLLYFVIKDIEKSPSTYCRALLSTFLHQNPCLNNGRKTWWLSHWGLFLLFVIIRFLAPGQYNVLLFDVKCKWQGRFIYMKQNNIKDDSYTGFHHLQNWKVPFCGGKSLERVQRVMYFLSRF